MNQPLPVTIYKTVWGQLGIFFLAFATLLAIFWALDESFKTPWADPMVMLGIGTLVVALVTAYFVVWLYQYGLSYVTLTSDGLVAVNWKTLFHKQDVQAEWYRVQDVSVVASGFFAQMLGFGTLNVQTAGERQAVRLTMLPNVEYWQDVVASYADAATPDRSTS